MEIQRLYSYLRQAIDEYKMIDEGDRIAVGVSGGKDSFALLYGLSGLRRFYPKRFELEAVTVDLGYKGFDYDKISKVCQSLEVKHTVVHTQICDMVEDGQCSLCARLRKGAFNNAIKELSCNKFAYAHNMDDVIETLMLSLIYEGRISTFWPVTEYEDSKLTMIRPMIYVPKADVTGFCNKYEIELVVNPCPFEKNTQRAYVRELIKNIEHHAPGARKRMMTAIRNGNLEGYGEV